MAEARLGHRTCCRDYGVIPERERLFVSPPAKPPGVTPLIDPDPYRLQTDRIVEPGEIPRGYKLNARRVSRPFSRPRVRAERGETAGLPAHSPGIHCRDRLRAGGGGIRTLGPSSQSESRRPAKSSGKVPDTHSIGAICNQNLGVFTVTEIA